MPPTTSYRFGDIVLVPFPFTDQTTFKKRPAVIVSSAAYHQERSDVIVMAITSQASDSPRSGEVQIREWRTAGLLKPSVIKPVLATLSTELVLRSLGQLATADITALKAALPVILGD